MKKLCLFKIATLGVILSSVPAVLTSCFDSGDRQIDDDHFKFINDIEFSVAGTDDGSSFSLGTAWVYKVVDSANYKYRLITNYHVYDGFRSATKYFYAFNTYDKKDSQINIYDVSKNEIVGETSTMLNPFFIQTRSNPGIAYIDICSIDLDFSKTVSNDSILKQKLDKINLLEDKTTHNVLKINGTKTGHNKKRVYLAGYPWSTSKSDRDYTYFTEWYDTVDKFQQNALNSFPGIPYETFQDQYWLHPQSEFLLGGGASGSLVINEDYEATGIYWGGASNGYSFSPSFAIFYMGDPVTGSKNKFETDFFYSLDNRN